MTASEHKYLIAANELNHNGNGARMAAMMQRLNVAKVSVCRAVVKLIAGGYLCQNGKKILLIILPVRRRQPNLRYRCS